MLHKPLLGRRHTRPGKVAGLFASINDLETFGYGKPRLSERLTISAGSGAAKLKLPLPR